MLGVKGYITLVGLVFSLAPAVDARAGEWGGRETTEDGVLHVINPGTPVEGEMSVTLNELWRIGGDTDDDDEFFGVLNQVTTDDEGNVYLLDRQLSEVKVFSPDGEFVTSMGREGEGPGEFRRPSDLFITPDGRVAVMQAAPGKIVLFTKDGAPAGEYPIPTAEDGGFRFFTAGRMNAGQVILSMGENSFGDEGMTRRTHLVRVDETGTETARYMTLTTEWRRSDRVVREADSRGWWVNWDVAPDGRVYVNWEYDDYAVHVWNPDGSKDRVIRREEPPRMRTTEEREQAYQRLSGLLRRIPNSELEVAESDQAIRDLYVRDDGSLWVLSSRGAKDVATGTIGRFDVYDKDGRLARQVALAGEGRFEEDGFFFSRDRLYVVLGLRSAQQAMQGNSDDEVVELDDAEPIAVVCYELNGVNL